MSSLRRHRRWLVLSLAAALLWVQWLTAAYACPQLRGAAAAGDAVEAAVVAFDAAPAAPAAPWAPAADEFAHCAEHGAMAMDPEQPQLCKAHCQAGQQTVNSQAGAFDAPPLALAAAAVVGQVAALEPSLPPAGWAEARAAGPPRGAPPLYLSLQVLRN